MNVEPILLELVRWINENKDKESRAVPLAKLPEHLKTPAVLCGAVNQKLVLFGKRKYCTTAKVDPRWEKNPKGLPVYEKGHQVPGTRDELYAKGELVSFDAGKNEMVPDPEPVPQQVRLEAGWEEWKELKGIDTGTVVDKMLDDEIVLDGCKAFPAEARVHIRLSGKGYEATLAKVEAKKELVGAK